MTDPGRPPVELDSKQGLESGERHSLAGWCRTPTGIFRPSHFTFACSDSWLIHAIELEGLELIVGGCAVPASVFEGDTRVCMPIVPRAPALTMRVENLTTEPRRFCARLHPIDCICPECARVLVD